MMLSFTWISKFMSVSILIIIVLLEYGNCFHGQDLDIGQSLRVFQNCLVHVIYNHIDPKDRKSYDGSYNLAPFHFPIVLSQHKYKFTGRKPKTTDLACLKYGIVLWPKNQSQIFRAIPQQTLSQCGVIVYVDSPWCRGIPIMMDNTPPPPDFMYVLYNQYNIQKRNWFRTITSGVFLVHFGRIQNHRDVFKKVEDWWSLLGAPTLPIMISFDFHWDKSKSRYLVSERGRIHACQNIKLYVTTLKRKCPMNGSGFAAMLPYMFCSLPFSNLMQYHEITYSPDSVASWNKIADMGYEHCEDRTLIWVATITEDLPPCQGCSEYLLDWRHGVGTISHIYARAFLRNLTYISYEPVKEGNMDFLYFQEMKFKQVNQNGVQKSNLQSMQILSSLYINSELYYTGWKNDEIHFVMCSKMRKIGKLSLLGYISAFQWEVWACFILTILVGGSLIGLTKLIVPPIHEKEIVENGFNCFYEFINTYRMFFNDGVKIVTNYRWFFGAWGLGWLVLSESYLGDNIETLSAPIPVYRFNTFEHVLGQNVSVYSPVLNDNAESNVALSLFKELNVGVTKFARPTLFREAYEAKNMMPKERLEKLEPNRNSDIPNSLREKFLLGEISNCSNLVYVDVWPNMLRVKLKALQSILNRKIKLNFLDIVSSEHKFGQLYRNLRFSNLRISPEVLLRRFHSFMHSGIDQLWGKWKTRIESWNDTYSTRRIDDKGFRPATLRGNIVVVFYIHFGLLTLTIFGLIAEWFISKEFRERVRNRVTSFVWKKRLLLRKISLQVKPEGLDERVELKISRK